MTTQTAEDRKSPSRAGAWCTAVLVSALALSGNGGFMANALAAPVPHTQAMARPPAGEGTCALLSLARAGSLAGGRYTSTAAATIAPGQDQCTYNNPDGPDLVIIVYQPGSGVTFSMLVTVLKGVGTVKVLRGLGDKAVVGAIELDVQAGKRLLAVQGAGGTVAGGYSGNYSRAIAVAKAVLARLR
jgi:hypothetical protein